MQKGPLVSRLDREGAQEEEKGGEMRSESGVRRVKLARRGRMEGSGQRGQSWGGGNIRGQFWGRTMSRVGMAGRVQRRRGLLVMRDPRTETQGLAGSPGVLGTSPRDT